MFYRGFSRNLLWMVWTIRRKDGSRSCIRGQDYHGNVDECQWFRIRTGSHNICKQVNRSLISIFVNWNERFFSVRLYPITTAQYFSVPARYAMSWVFSQNTKPVSQNVHIAYIAQKNWSFDLNTYLSGIRLNRILCIWKQFVHTDILSFDPPHVNIRAIRFQF